MKYFALSLLIFSHLSFGAIEKIYSTHQKRDITKAELFTILPNLGFVVLGEYHNDPLIQSAEAEIIKGKTLMATQKGNIALMWEFLDFTDQAKIDMHYKEFVQGTIDSATFINQTAGANNQTYSVIFDEIKTLDAQVYGINLPRSVKQKVITDGIGSVDPIYVPATHYTGDQDYRDRFTVAMGNHVPADKLEDYFVAQCLTDSMMAHQSHTNHLKDLNFIIAGSFHTDFGHGTIVRLQNLTASEIKTIKLINSNNIDETQREEFLQGHSKYGVYADFLIFVK